MTITEFAGKRVNLGSTKILILDIGAGGLRIETNVKLPVRSDLLLRFTTELFGERLNLYGSIVWHEEYESEYEAYGISFIIDDNVRTHLTYFLNQLQVKLRQNTILPDCSFVIEDKKSFFLLKHLFYYKVIANEKGLSGASFFLRVCGESYRYIE